MLIVLCDKTIDEVKGTRCVLSAHHTGPCKDGSPVREAPIPWHLLKKP